MTVWTETVAGTRPAVIAVTLAVPASALVVTSAMVEIAPAGIETRVGTDAMSGLSDVSWTTVSELEVIGVLDDVWRPTSRTL